jgi:serine/threonine protein kinase
VTLLPGTKLGPYEILEPIGAGGMGEVYRAHDPRVGRDVAIKVSSEQFTDRFAREIHAVAALNHSNVCTLYDVGPNYLVMELVEGPTLADRIKQGPIPLEESLEIARQIADALEAAHEKGIVHRDLKPGNIKLRPDGTVKVLDFGLAKVEEATAISLETSPTLSVAQTAAGVLLGTAAYMSPEQARGKPVDKRADIWAFGVVLYEMLTGSRLFSGETVSDTMAGVLTKEPDWRKVPAKVLPILRRCLEKDPKKRLRDIGDAIPLLEGTPESAPARRPWLAWSIAAVLLIALLLLAGPRFFEQPPVPEAPVRSQIALPEKVTADPSDSFSLSPDGRHLAFTAAGSDGVMRLWIRTLDALQARQVPGTESNWIPMFFWSPDSRFVAFSSGGKLKKVDIGGGAPSTICDLPMSALGGSWNRDGLIVFGTGPTGILGVAASGGSISARSRVPNGRKLGITCRFSSLMGGISFTSAIRQRPGTPGCMSDRSMPSLKNRS